MQSDIIQANLAIACAAGGYRGAFSHGVLTAFERAGLRAAAYSAASSTVLPTAYAAAGAIDRLQGAEYWKHGWRVFQRSGSMSHSYIQGLAEYTPWLKRSLFHPNAARLLIPASWVNTDSAAERTQGKGFLRLGREQLLAIRRKDSSWARENLDLQWFDSKPRGKHRPLTPDNMADVFYASSRYLHSAWDQPAWIDGEAYVDAVYTAAIPVEALHQSAAKILVVIHHDPGQAFLDFYRTKPLPDASEDEAIHVIGPKLDLAEIGVEVMNATEGGLDEAYQLGLAQGRQWLDDSAGVIGGSKSAA